MESELSEISVTPRVQGHWSYCLVAQPFESRMAKKILSPGIVISLRSCCSPDALLAARSV